jgi:uncharacterized protein with NAD-binding domain and iron-sulfur cluster
MTAPPRVTIAGGGLAGLTAALRLAERGYRVKVFEQKPTLGGNLGSRSANGVALDIYPHMYLPWYHNFWRLLRDVTGRERDELFLQLSSVKQLRKGEFPRFAGLTDMYAPWRIPQNLLSGVGSVADMLVFGYASIDLVAERLNPTMLPDDLSVAGFLNARPYMTREAADAFDNFITTVWAIPSYATSAADYRAYLEHSFGRPTPAFWLARGSSSEQVIGPLTAALEAAGVEIVREVQVTSVSCRDRRVTKIGLQAATQETWEEDVDELILAVPAPALSRLVRSGEPGARIIEVEPQMAELSRLRTQEIPILNLFLRRRLSDLPREPVGLFRSELSLSFTDISQSWRDLGDRTVLAVSASDPHRLPRTSDEDDGMAMLRELAEYVTTFRPGTAWGESEDIDWEATRYDPNTDAQLFVNEEGSDVWRPAATCEGVANLSFACDFCRNRVGMTTIESAVTTGLEAARAVVERHGIGTKVEIAQPRSLPGAVYVWLRYAWAPYAAAAKAWSTGRGLLTGLAGHLRDS